MAREVIWRKKSAVDRGQMVAFQTKIRSNILKKVAVASDSLSDELINACEEDQHDMVKRLLNCSSHYLNINQKRKTDSATALLVACCNGATECVRHLLSNSMVSINASAENGRSPFFIASLNGHTEIVQMLIEHSHRMQRVRMKHGMVDFNQRDNDGFVCCIEHPNIIYVPCHFAKFGTITRGCAKRTR